MVGRATLQVARELFNAANAAAPDNHDAHTTIAEAAAAGDIASYIALRGETDD
jgi:hypothetical protein